MKTTNMQWAAIAGLLALYLVYSSFYTIDTSNEGVVTRFGAFHKIAGPGPHLKIPGIDNYIPIPVTRIHEEAFGFRKDQGKGQLRISKQTARLESLMLTGDLNVAHRDIDIYNYFASHIKKTPGCTQVLADV